MIRPALFCLLIATLLVPTSNAQPGYDVEIPRNQVPPKPPEPTGPSAAEKQAQKEAKTLAERERKAREGSEAEVKELKRQLAAEATKRQAAEAASEEVRRRAVAADVAVKKQAAQQAAEQAQRNAAAQARIKREKAEAAAAQNKKAKEQTAQQHAAAAEQAERVAEAEKEARRTAQAEQERRDAAAKAERERLAREETSQHGQQILKDCDVCSELVVIPAGNFTMGSSAAEQALANAAGVNKELTDRENPQHRVNVPSFAAGRYAVTKNEFAAFVRAKSYQTEAERDGGCYFMPDNVLGKDSAYNWRNTVFSQADDHPVVCVSWNDAQAYIAWLSQHSGKQYRLLSEAEREYVTRAGEQTAFWWGDSINTNQANYGGTGPSYNGSPQGEYRAATVPVKSFSANSFGLYNVHGNTFEWVQDCKHDNYKGAPVDGSAWTTACSSSSRELRGSSFRSFPSEARAAFRISLPPGSSYNGIGFRVARTAP